MTHPQPRHETGFPEPFSRDRNTTLPHSEGVTRPSEESPTTVIERRHRKAGQVEDDMYAGLVVHDNPDGTPEQEEGEVRKDSKIKWVLRKISCGGF